MQINNKMPFYSFVNILLSGLVAIGATAFLCWADIECFVLAVIAIDSTGLEAIIILIAIAIAYESGYIIFRLGAVVIEPIARKADRRFSYANFADAQRSYPVLSDLSREYGFARTRIVLFFLIGILSVIKAQWLLLCLCIICIILMLITLRSHSKKINEIVKQHLINAVGYDFGKAQEGTGQS